MLKFKSLPPELQARIYARTDILGTCAPSLCWDSDHGIVQSSNEKKKCTQLNQTKLHIPRAEVRNPANTEFTYAERYFQEDHGRDVIRSEYRIVASPLHKKIRRCETQDSGGIVYLLTNLQKMMTRALYSTDFLQKAIGDDTRSHLKGNRPEGILTFYSPPFSVVQDFGFNNNLSLVSPFGTQVIQDEPFWISEQATEIVQDMVSRGELSGTLILKWNYSSISHGRADDWIQGPEIRNAVLRFSIPRFKRFPLNTKLV